MINVELQLFNPYEEEFKQLKYTFNTNLLSIQESNHQIFENFLTKCSDVKR